MGMHTNGPDYTTRDIRRTIKAWLDEVAPPSVAMVITAEHIEALVRSVRPICKSPT